jgi:hypothetical protein
MQWCTAAVFAGCDAECGEYRSRCDWHISAQCCDLHDAAQRASGARIGSTGGLTGRPSSAWRAFREQDVRSCCGWQQVRSGIRPRFHKRDCASIDRAEWIMAYSSCRTHVYSALCQRLDHRNLESLESQPWRWYMAADRICETGDERILEGILGTVVDSVTPTIASTFTIHRDASTFATDPSAIVRRQVLLCEGVGSAGTHEAFDMFWHQSAWPALRGSS